MIPTPEAFATMCRAEMETAVDSVMAKIVTSNDKWEATKLFLPYLLGERVTCGQQNLFFGALWQFSNASYIINAADELQEKYGEAILSLANDLATHWEPNNN